MATKWRGRWECNGRGWAIVMICMHSCWVFLNCFYYYYYFFCLIINEKKIIIWIQYMYYGGICDSDKCFSLSILLLALSIWQTRCIMYNMTNFGQINNFLVLVFSLSLLVTIPEYTCKHMSGKFHLYTFSLDVFWDVTKFHQHIYFCIH